MSDFLLILAVLAFALAFIADRFGDDYDVALMVLAFGLFSVCLITDADTESKAWRDGYKCARAGGELVESGNSYRCEP